jgi:hypothetical protein
MPVIGYLSARPRDTDASWLASFRKGLSERGYIEGRNGAGGRALPERRMQGWRISSPGAKTRWHCGSMRSASHCAALLCEKCVSRPRHTIRVTCVVLVRHTAPNTPLPYGAGGVPGFLNTASMAGSLPITG